MTVDRPLRADAQRNRDTLLLAAAAAFAESGPEVSLQEIATRANVGIGTLYRHFPDRRALILDVYRRNVVALCDGVRELLDRYPADEALEVWLGRFVEHVQAHLAMKVMLTDADADGASAPGPVFSELHALLTTTIGVLLQRASEQGCIGSRLEPADLLRALGGLCQVNTTPEQATRLIRLMVDGLRYAAPVGAHHHQA